MKSLVKSFNVINPVTGESFNQIRRSPRVFSSDPSLYEPGDNPVQQQFKNECDINYIVKNYQIPHQSFKPEDFGDFSDAPTFMESMNIVVTAQQQFLKLPAAIRSRFQNEPAKFLEFVGNPENHSELIKMGLARKIDPTPEPQPVRVIIDNSGDSDEPLPPKQKGSKST